MGSDAATAAGAVFINIDPFVVVALLGLGFLGGMLSGFIGSGGAFVLTPGMMNLGVPGSVAVASNMCHKFPKAIVGSWKRRKLGHVDLKLGLIMAVSAIAGVRVGVEVQNAILEAWGTAGSNLYISVAFVVVLLVVGWTMLRDVRSSMRVGSDDCTAGLAKRVANLNIPPMVRFGAARVRTSLWITVPLGFATGMLAATIAVGGFVGVPGMIYVIGAPAFVASGTELVIAVFSGLEGTIEWGMRGFVDLRLTLLILAGSLIGVQIGALGTTYVKQYMIKLVSALVMILAAVSRAMMVPVYLSGVGLLAVDETTSGLLTLLSSVVLYGTLISAGVLIIVAMLKGKRAAEEARGAAVLPEASTSPELVH